MKLTRKNFLLTLWVLGLFTLTSLIVPLVTGFHEPSINPINYAEGSGSYIEDFSSTTHMDVVSDVDGWGTGIVTKSRISPWAVADHYYTNSPVYDVEVQGRKAYIAMYNETYQDGIAILDINDITDIKLQGMQTNPSFSEAKAIAVEGDILVAGQHHGMVQDAVVIHNVQDAANPAWTWATGFYNLATDIEFYGHLAFFTSYNPTDGGSLRFIDLEYPFASSPIYTCDWNNNYSLGLDVEGGYAYVAASHEGFYVLNITSKLVPTVVGHEDTPGNATDVIVDGRYAYIADGPDGVHIVDIGNINNPHIIDSFDLPGGYTRKLAKQGETLYVADGESGVHILDVSNPHEIIYVDTIPLPYAYDVALFGGDLVVGTAEGVFTVSVGEMANFLGSWYPNPFEAPAIWDVRVVDGIAYIAAGVEGIYTVNVRDPFNPILLDSYNCSGYDIRKVDINGKYLYAIGFFGPHIFDVSDPANIKKISHFFGAGFSDVYIHGEILFCSFTTGFTIWNVSSNYQHIVLVNYIPGIHNNNTAIWVQGTHVYMVEGDSAGIDTLSCYDVTDFTSPTLTDSKARIPPMWDVHVDGDLCYLGAGGWLSIYNCSDPTNLMYPGYEITPSWGVWSFGRYVVSAERNEGIKLYDVSDVTNPTMISQFTGPADAYQVTMDGDFTYVADRDSLHILRHYLSPADTYVGANNTAQSIKVDTESKWIKTATLECMDNIEPMSGIHYYLSADGGTHWELVTPGVLHTFANPGSDLHWKAIFEGPSDRSARLYQIEINYEYTFLSPTMWYIIGGGAGGLVLLVIIIAVVVRAAKKKKTSTR